MVKIQNISSFHHHREFYGAVLNPTYMFPTSKRCLEWSLAFTSKSSICLTWQWKVFYWLPNYLASLIWVKIIDFGGGCFGDRVEGVRRSLWAVVAHCFGVPCQLEPFTCPLLCAWFQHYFETWLNCITFVKRQGNKFCVIHSWFCFSSRIFQTSPSATHLLFPVSP